MKVLIFKEYICPECRSELFRLEFAQLLQLENLPVEPPQEKQGANRVICCITPHCKNYGKWVIANPEELELEEID